MSCARNRKIILQAALAEFASRDNSLQEREEKKRGKVKGETAAVTSSLGLLETKSNRNGKGRGNRAKYSRYYTFNRRQGKKKSSEREAKAESNTET